MNENLIEIPWQDLEAETLQSLILEFVTRDGTDYGLEEISAERKVEQVLAGIKNKHWVIVFDADNEQCNIIDREVWNNFAP